MPGGEFPIDPLSEMLALSTSGSRKNLIIAIVVYTGPLDKEIMTEACRRAKKDFPEMVCRLKEVKHRGRYYLYREWRPDLDTDMSFFDVTLEGGETEIDAVLRILSPRLDRDWDLFNECLGEVHMGRVFEERHLMVTVAHHAAADAAIATNFGFAIGKKYCEIIGEGNSELWPNAGSLSTSRKRAAKLKERTFKDTIAEAKDAFAPFFEKSQLPVGQGLESDTGQFHVKRLFSEEDTNRIMDYKRIGLVDRLVYASNLAIDQWNQNRNIEPATLRTSLTVNMQGRYSWFDKPNNSGVITFEANADDRRDPDEFMKKISRSRIRQFRNHMDLRFFINVRKMNDTFRILPFRLRRKIVNFIMERRQYSIGVTMLGTMNPEIRNGRPTSASIRAILGELYVSEIHGIGYKLLSKTHLVLIAYVYHKNLNIVMATDACHFTRQEAEEFLDLVIDNLEIGAIGKGKADG